MYIMKLKLKKHIFKTNIFSTNLNKTKLKDYYLSSTDNPNTKTCMYV